MFRNKATYFVVFVLLLFTLLIVIEHYASRKVDWTETFDRYSKSPYGCYVLNDMLNDVFPNQPVEYNSASFFEMPDTISPAKNLLVITSAFDPDPESLKALLKFAWNGNAVFISANWLGKSLSDSLNVKVSASIDSVFNRSRNHILKIDHPHFKGKTDYLFSKGFPLAYFSSFDSLQTVKLGTCLDGKPDFIRVKCNSGNIYLHLQPQVFTNYHILYGNARYAAAVLSHLPVQPVISDDYYKPYRIVDTSPVRYILSQDSLRMAYYLLLITLALYMIVGSKRRQRVIPVIQPPENKSLDFVKTVGNLYFNQKDNSDLGRKMILYFKDFIRERYFIQHLEVNEDCIQKLAEKSGLSRDRIRNLLGVISYYESAVTISNEELMKLNETIEHFYEHCL